MLELGRIDKKSESSNEGLIEFGVSVVLVGAIIGIMWLWAWLTRDKSPQVTEDAKRTLVKHYANICKYINTELQDDTFFFKDAHAWMVSVNNCLLCAKERIMKSPKLINMPEPSSSETIDSYDKKLAQYFGNKKFYMEHIDEWDDPSFGMSKAYAGHTYKEGGWLESNKVCELFTLISQCQKYDKLIHAKMTKIYGTRLKDEEDGKYWTLADSDIMRKYIGEEFFANDDADHSDSWDSGPGQNVDEILHSMTKHLRSYLIQKYGSDAIKKAVAKFKAKTQ